MVGSTGAGVIMAINIYISKRQRRIDLAKKIALGILAWIVMINVMAFVLVFALDQHEKERQWRADRLCSQGYYCDPKAGP